MVQIGNGIILLAIIGFWKSLVNFFACKNCFRMLFFHTDAGMSELADEADSKSVVGNYVWVQVPLPAALNPGLILIPGYFFTP